MKNIIVGISSGIACYKVIDLVKKLKEKKFNVNVIMTKNTLNLVDAREFEKASGNKVAVETFNKKVDYKYYLKNNKKIKHISLADKADLVIIAPATANVIGKIANGYADDLLTTTVLATTAPIVVCPSMNVHMWQNKVVKENVKKLRELGHYIVMPEYGKLACGYSGIGRLADLDKVLKLVNKKEDLKGKKILITAGPTQEEIDPVRIITNKSSGRMGHALAQRAALRGADVVLVSGPTSLEVPFGVKYVRVTSAAEMYNQVRKYFSKIDVFISAAAVSDFKVKKSKEKIKKTDKLVLELEKNVDILKEVSKVKGNKKLIGFALETENLVKNATLKLKEKNLDFIVANKAQSLNSDNADFIIIKNNKLKKFKNISKESMAEEILDLVK